MPTTPPGPPPCSAAVDPNLASAWPQDCPASLPVRPAGASGALPPHVGSHATVALEPTPPTPAATHGRPTSTAFPTPGSAVSTALASTPSPGRKRHSPSTARTPSPALRKPCPPTPTSSQLWDFLSTALEPPVNLHVHICQKYIQIQHGHELLYLVCI
jgi:hypothetical protein